MSGPGAWLHNRRSSQFDGSGLLVLGLGALVLLAGLGTPAPPRHDVLAVVGVTLASNRHTIPQWMGGLAMIGVALIIVGVRMRTQALIQYATSGS